MRAIVDRGGLDRAAASTSQMGRFETAWLSSEANLAALADLFGAWIDRVHECKPQTTIVLDMDSSVSETHGAQEGTAYNGHFACMCYHPLFVFNQFGDLERCALRPGNVHSADGWKDILEPVIARYRNKMKRRYFRGDAAFANPEVYELLEAEGYKYAIRSPVNSVLQELIGWLLERIPVILQHIRRERRSLRRLLQAAVARTVRSGGEAPLRCARRTCAGMP